MKAGGMQVMPQYEIVFKIDLGNMDYKINEEDTVVNIDGNQVILYNLI